MAAILIRGEGVGGVKSSQFVPDAEQETTTKNDSLSHGYLLRPLKNNLYNWHDNDFMVSWI